MEVISSNIIGYYGFKTTINGNEERCDTCLICHNSFYTPNINQLQTNKNITKNDDKVIGQCGHVFHSNCIQIWTSNNKKTCPVCKQKWVSKELIDEFTTLKYKNKEEVKIKKNVPNLIMEDASDHDESEDDE